MLCKHARRQIEQMSQPKAATASLKQHLANCGSCRKLSDERRFLQNAIARLRSETSRVGPSRHVEDHVLTALNSRALRPHAVSSTRRWYTVGALASLLLLIAITLMKVRPNRTIPLPRAADEQFTAMPYVIPPAPYERTSVVRTEIPLQILLSAGFQVQSDDPSSSALADVLYGEDGRILALRLVPRSNNFPTTRMD
jgi:hypothetical protein